jgi:hypothetical protein
MTDEAKKRRSTDRGRLGRGFISLSSVTVVGIMFNIISSVSHQAHTAIELAEQQGTAIIQLREDVQSTRDSYAVMFSSLVGKVDSMRGEIDSSTDDRFRGEDWETERAKLLELMEAHMHALERELDQISGRMEAHEFSCPYGKSK